MGNAESNLYQANQVRTPTSVPQENVPPANHHEATKTQDGDVPKSQFAITRPALRMVRH